MGGVQQPGAALAGPGAHRSGSATPRHGCARRQLGQRSRRGWLHQRSACNSCRRPPLPHLPHRAPTVLHPVVRPNARRRVPWGGRGQIEEFNVIEGRPAGMRGLQKGLVGLCELAGWVQGHRTAARETKPAATAKKVWAPARVLSSCTCDLNPRRAPSPLRAAFDGQEIGRH